jgi:anti-sigma factor RsiW
MAAGSLENLDISEALSLLNRSLDGDLDADQEAVLARQLGASEDLRGEFEGLNKVVEGLRALPFEFAPDDFVDKVEGRMRKQSAGRLFAQDVLLKARVPYEAIAVVMMIIMAAAYLLLESPLEMSVKDVDVSAPVIKE